MKRVDGSELMCDKHGLDYRILCEECVEKFHKFGTLTRRMIRDNIRLQAISKKDKKYEKMWNEYLEARHKE